MFDMNLLKFDANTLFSETFVIIFLNFKLINSYMNGSDVSLKKYINTKVLSQLSRGIVLKIVCSFSASTNMKYLTKWPSSKLLKPYL